MALIYFSSNSKLIQKITENWRFLKSKTNKGTDHGLYVSRVSTLGNTANPEKGDKQKAGSKMRRKQNRLLDSVGEEEGGWFERIALKRTHYHMWNRESVGVWCVTRGTQSRCSVTSWRGGVGREAGEELRREGIHMYSHGWFMLMYGENHHNTIIILQL